MSDPTPEQAARIRDWIRTETAGTPLEAIRDSVASRYSDMCEAIGGFTREALTTASPGEEWAPIDALKHLAEWNWLVGEAVLHTSLTGERPNNPLPSFPREIEALQARLTESADSVWAHVSAADPAGFLETTWEHPFFGQLNWREWYFFLGVHALDHTRQVLAMKAGHHA